MNSLELYLNGGDEIDAMNRLQDCGIVSDNAVDAKDVAECDCARSVAWLNAQATAAKA